MGACDCRKCRGLRRARRAPWTRPGKRPAARRLSGNFVFFVPQISSSERAGGELLIVDFKRKRAANMRRGSMKKFRVPTPVSVKPDASKRPRTSLSNISHNLEAAVQAERNFDESRSSDATETTGAESTESTSSAAAVAAEPVFATSTTAAEPAAAPHALLPAFPAVQSSQTLVL